MARKLQIPKYREKKDRGLAVVTIDKKHIYLGKYDSPESHAEYKRIIADWLLSKGRPPVPTTTDQLTVDQVLHAYWLYAKKHYVKCGRPVNSQLAVIKGAFRPLHRLFGPLPAAEFGKKQLKQFREALIDAQCPRCQATGKVNKRKRRRHGGQPLKARAEPKVEKVPCPRCHGLTTVKFTRKTVNKYVAVIRQAWRWACEEEMLPDHLWQSLMVVRHIEEGRDGVPPDPDDIGPVDEETIAQTVKHLNPVVAAMVQVQRLALMRPCEVRGMRAEDIDRNGRLPNGQMVEAGVWVYVVRDQFNKLAHKKIVRTVLLGPKAQAILAPFIARRPSGFLFSPKEAAERWQESNWQRVPGRRSRAFGEFYDHRSYNHAIERGAKRAGVAHWHPNQLRHSGITEWRDLLDLKTAGDAAGHQSLDTTRRYAEIRLQKAAEMARKIG